MSLYLSHFSPKSLRCVFFIFPTYSALRMNQQRSITTKAKRHLLSQKFSQSCRKCCTISKEHTQRSHWTSGQMNEIVGFRVFCLPTHSTQMIGASSHLFVFLFCSAILFNAVPLTGITTLLKRERVTTKAGCLFAASAKVALPHKIRGQ